MMTKRIPTGWSAWISSIVFVGIVFGVAMSLDIINHLWGYGGPRDETLILLAIALGTLGLNLFQLWRRSSSLIGGVIALNVLIAFVPNGPVDLAMRDVTDLMYWKEAGKNQFQVADAGSYPIRAALVTRYGPDHIFRISESGMIEVVKGYGLKEWNRFRSLTWRANPFSGVMDEVKESRTRQLDPDDMQHLHSAVRAVLDRRLPYLWDVNPSTTMYVEYHGSTSAFDEWQVYEETALWEFLKVLARLSPISVEPCNIVSYQREECVSKAD